MRERGARGAHCPPSFTCSPQLLSSVLPGDRRYARGNGRRSLFVARPMAGGGGAGGGRRGGRAAVVVVAAMGRVAVRRTSGSLACGSGRASPGRISLSPVLPVALANASTPLWVTWAAAPAGGPAPACPHVVRMDGCGPECAPCRARRDPGPPFQWSRLIVERRDHAEAERSRLPRSCVGRQTHGLPDGAPHTPQAHIEASPPRLWSWVVVQPLLVGGAPRAGPTAAASAATGRGWPRPCRPGQGCGSRGGGGNVAPGILPPLARSRTERRRFTGHVSVVGGAHCSVAR